jgi:putative transcriptional regulator
MLLLTCQHAIFYIRVKIKGVVNMKVIIKLNSLLEDKGYSHRELARLTGIRHPSISEMCNNTTKRIPLDNLAKICEVLNCEITDILELQK